MLSAPAIAGEAAVRCELASIQTQTAWHSERELMARSRRARAGARTILRAFRVLGVLGVFGGIDQSGASVSVACTQPGVPVSLLLDGILDGVCGLDICKNHQNLECKARMRCT